MQEGDRRTIGRVVGHTAAEITPVRQVDRRAVGSGRPGELTLKVQKLYGDGVRGRIEFMRSMLTPFEV